MILGNMLRGTPMMSATSLSQSSVLRFINIVRLALVTSVMWTPPLGPPVSHQMTQVSMLPKTASPRSAAALASGTLSRIQRTLGPEK